MPFIKHLIENTQSPIIIIAEDSSESILSGMDESQLQDYTDKMNGLASRLSEKYEVKRYHFGENVESGAIDSFNAASTNIDVQLDFVENQFADQNIGAVILASDGIFNEGKSPIYSDLKIKAPIHTIALGDTTVRRDLLIKNVLNNRIAYLGDQFNMQVDVQSFNASGSSSQLTITKIKDGNSTKVKSESFTINSNNFFKTFSFNIDATDTGNVKYRISLNRISDELSGSNNTRDVYIEILDARQKILLFANAPHPDLAALKSIIESNKNYEVDIHFASKPSPNLNQFDIVVLHNLPSSKNPVNSELTLLKSRRIPTIFFVGNQVNLAAFNSSQKTLSIKGNVSSMNEVQAIWDDGFKGFQVDEGLKRELPKFVPVNAPFGEYEAGPNAEVLLLQKIGKVDTKYPLITFGEEGSWKNAVFAGEGVWKWKLFEFLQYQSYDNLNELVNKLVQYSSKKEDKRKFRAFVNKSIFKDNEEVVFDAQLYNSNYELINEPDVFLKVSDKSGNVYDYTFSKFNNYYSHNAGVLKEGNYSFTASTNFNGEKLSASGNFSIQSIQKEQYDLTARHGMLKSLSSRFGGRTYYLDAIDQLGSDILGSESIKPVIYQRNKTESLLNMKWLFGLIGLFLCLEWFLRRFYGSY